MITLPQAFGRLRPALVAGAVGLLVLAGVGAGPATAAEERLTLEAGTPTPLALEDVSGPSLRLGLDVGGPALPLSTRGLTPGRPPAPAAAEPSAEALGTRLTVGQPLGVDFLGGAVDWRAAATLETAPEAGNAYGLTLSLGSLSDAGGSAPPSDLRIGLTYGRESDDDEQGILLDFSYSF